LTDLRVRFVAGSNQASFPARSARFHSGFRRGRQATPTDPRP
jgi:hypothetical protein